MNDRAGVEPNLTDVAPEKLNPVTTIPLPPPTTPLVGRIPVTTGQTGCVARSKASVGADGDPQPVARS